MTSVRGSGKAVRQGELHIVIKDIIHYTEMHPLKRRQGTMHCHVTGISLLSDEDRADVSPCIGFSISARSSFLP